VNLFLPKENSYRIDLVLAAIHLCISWWVIIGVGSSCVTGLWQLIWINFALPDFPISLLWLVTGDLLPDWHIAALGEPIGDFQEFLLPAFFFGIVAPVWYFFLPKWITSVFT
jgi:hypothetical protein